ncbi:hypothetical protein BK125_19575 [Paenibacillus odorifer]|nr:hypothetical protein BK125_19575 [Paenibacillus odorifer]OMD84111.1 hypothetical protein BSK67_30080 [Paenibacillus odorifer]
MTSVIFNNEGVLSQLQQAQKDRKDGISTYSDSEEEFAEFLNEESSIYKYVWVVATIVPPSYCLPSSHIHSMNSIFRYRYPHFI